jgi:light-regulated signal transduction histidine kinase (bacteriophytochrome)
MHEDAEQKAQLEQSHLTIEEEVARRTADLARKNKELDEFTYVASHDLQEPVRKLISFSKLLEQDAGEALPERRTAKRRRVQHHDRSLCHQYS